MEFDIFDILAPRTAEQLFLESTSVPNLMGVYLYHVHRKKARGRDGVVPESLEHDMEDVCTRLSQKLRNGEHRFTQYRELLASKGAGKNPRVLSIPSARDRIALRALAEFLGKVYPGARGVIPQVRVREVHEVLRKKQHKAFVRLDVKNFYPSISHSVVRDALEKNIEDQKVIDILLRAIETPTVLDGAPRGDLQKIGVPQGLAISNILSELVVSPIDEAMKRDERCEYVRYVDDVLILCSHADVEPLQQKVSELFRGYELEVHDIKELESKSTSGDTNDGFEYLSYLFKRNRVSVKLSSVNSVESSLARKFTFYKKEQKTKGDSIFALTRCAWFVNLRITGCVHRGIARGWLQYFRQMNDMEVLKKLDITVRQFEQRFKMPEEFQVKSFVRAYWALRQPNGRNVNYIPNFDEMSIEDVRLNLAQIIGNEKVEKLTDDQVTSRFEAIIEKEVSELEKDIGSNY